MSAALHIVVSGFVQGVGFRYACLREARACGVTGWVRNGADGQVEIQVEGTPAALEDFQVWCRQGPSVAVVRQVAVTPVEPAGATGFEIRLR